MTSHLQICHSSLISCQAIIVDNPRIFEDILANVPSQDGAYRFKPQTKLPTLLPLSLRPQQWACLTKALPLYFPA